MGKQSRRKKDRKGPGAAELARRAKQRSALSDRQAVGTPLIADEFKDAAQASAATREQAVHVDSRDWREAKIQGREEEIVLAVNSGDTTRAREILEEVRANAGGCDFCAVKPEEGEGYVLSTTQGRGERRWGHRACLTETADRWFAGGREPVWTVGTSIFSSTTEDSVKHQAPQS